MKCPFCQYLENRVIDSRLAKEGDVIRRRRECDSCHGRFTTYERVEEMLPMVAKRDGSRVLFDRSKVIAGIRRACQKRPVPLQVIEGSNQAMAAAKQEESTRLMKLNSMLNWASEIALIFQLILPLEILMSKA